jgi:Zn-dependent metalloprotease
MQVQTRLLSLAIVAALAASAPAVAGNAFDGTSALRAKALVDGAAGKHVRRASADAFVARDAIVDADGTEHVRFERTWRGLPVIGGDFVLHSRNGKVRGVSQTLRTTKRPAATVRMTGSEAIVEAGTHFGSGFKGVPKSRQVVYAGGATPVMAYEVTFSGINADQTPTDMHYIVDANSGRILRKWDTVMTARPGPGGGGGGTTCTESVGTGHSLSEGTVAVDTAKCGNNYQLKDLTRGGGYTTNMGLRKTGMGSVFTDANNVWGNGALTSSQTVAVDAHWGVSMTWDYFAEKHGRQGIADDGRGAVSRVHYGRNYANAFWSDNCFCMTFGDGDNGVTINPLVALDVAGHEMTHGVTSRSAGLIYDGESGGLNEATSDIFGAMVEHFVNNPADTPDYLLAENIYAGNEGTMALRYMFKPSLDGASPDCYSSDLGDLDVHYSSGVANHFFYLLAEGAVVPAGFGAGTEANLTASSLVCNGNTALDAIGTDAAGAIWYRALTVYMTSDTNYAGARSATQSAAADLYGAGSAEYNAVAAAWDAVSVPAPVPALR